MKLFIETFPRPSHRNSFTSRNTCEHAKMELRDTRAVVLFVLLKVVLWAERQKTGEHRSTAAARDSLLPKVDSVRLRNYLSKTSIVPLTEILHLARLRIRPRGSCETPRVVVLLLRIQKTGKHTDKAAVRGGLLHKVDSVFDTG